MNYKFGDIIVRCYLDKYSNCIKTAICLCLDDLDGGHILYLDQSFSNLGGLQQLDTYGIGINYKGYEYRFATFDESIYILNVLKYYKKINDYNSIYGMRNSFLNIDDVINTVKKYINNFRKEKLLRIKKLNEKI